MIRYFSICFLLSIGQLIHAQVSDGLLVYLPFDDCTAVDVMGNHSGIIGGNPDCECGISGSSLRLDGVNDFIDLEGDLKSLFLGNFSVSFYFLAASDMGTSDLISYRQTCGIDSLFSIEYLGDTKSVTGQVNESIVRNVFNSGELDENKCWNHIVYVKNERLNSIYINGEILSENESTNPLFLFMDATFSISNSVCNGSSSHRFHGNIDEFRIYDRAITIEEARTLLVLQDQILSADTVITAGSFVQIQSAPSCAMNVSWTPASTVSNVGILNPRLTPTQTTKYTLEMSHDLCVTYDDINVTVVDPSLLSCNNLFLAKAFTPNGDGVNDQFGISNPYVLDRMVTFEIYDRWGGRMFSTSEPYGKWDGSYKGEPVNPGTYFYVVSAICEGNNVKTSGNVTVIR